MAGALGIQLAGDAWYFGKLHKKDFLGDKRREVEIEDIPRSHRLMLATCLLALLLFGLARAAICLGLTFFVGREEDTTDEELCAWRGCVPAIPGCWIFPPTSIPWGRLPA